MIASAVHIVTGMVTEPSVVLIGRRKRPETLKAPDSQHPTTVRLKIAQECMKMFGDCTAENSTGHVSHIVGIVQCVFQHRNKSTADEKQ